MKRWDIWIGINIIVTTTIFAIYFPGDSGNSLPHFLTALLVFSMMTGLFGHSHQVRIGTCSIWKGLFVALVAVIGYLVFINIYGYATDPDPYALLMHGNNLKILTAQAGVIIMLMPSLFGLYKYAYRSEHLWKNESFDSGEST